MSTIFSVVVPAFNRETTVERTMSSVLRAADHLGASGSGAQVILVDDGSTDSTAERAESIADADPRVEVVRQPNAGVSAARNRGAARATAPFLTFLDCDDEVAPEWLTALAAPLDAGADLVFAPGRAMRPGHPDELWPILPLGPVYGGIDGLFNPGMFAMRRADFDALGGYAVDLRFGENNELGIRITELLDAAGCIVAVALPEPLVVIHMDPSGRSNADRPVNRLAATRYLIDRHADRLALDPKLLSSYWAVSGVAAARLGRTREARHDLGRAARADPRNLKQLGRLAAAYLPPLRRRLWPVETTDGHT